MDREQIIKALEEHLKNYRDCEQQFKIKLEITEAIANALALINELTAKTEAQDITISELRQKLEKAQHDADRYARKIEELTEGKSEIWEERNRIYNDLQDWKEIAEQYQKQFEECYDEKERYKRYYFNHCFDELRANVEADVKADTVRKMQELIAEHATNGYPRKVRLDVVDQIANEILEGGTDG